MFRIFKLGPTSPDPATCKPCGKDAMGHGDSHRTPAASCPGPRSQDLRRPRISRSWEKTGDPRTDSGVVGILKRKHVDRKPPPKKSQTGPQNQCKPLLASSPRKLDPRISYSIRRLRAQGFHFHLLSVHISIGLEFKIWGLGLRVAICLGSVQRTSVASDRIP